MSLILSAGLEAERLWKRGARAVRNAEPAKIGSIAVEAALRAIGAPNVPGRGAGFFPRFPIKKWVSCNPNTRDERSHVASTRRRRPPQRAGQPLAFQRMDADPRPDIRPVAVDLAGWPALADIAERPRLT